MRWISRSRRDAATVASVLLSVTIGVVGNYLVADWYWALAAFLVVLIVCLAGLEVLRRRIDRLDRSAAASLSEPDRQVLIDKAIVAVRTNLREVAAGSPGDSMGALVAERLRATSSGAPALLNLALRPDDETGARAVSSALNELLRTDASFAAELASRLTAQASGGSAGAVTMTGDDWRLRGSVIAAGNVDQSRRTIRIGGAGVLVLALLLGTGVLGTGRSIGGAPGREQGAAVPTPVVSPTTTTTVAPTTTIPRVSPAPDDNVPRPHESFEVFSSGAGGDDFDPDTVTRGLDDMAYHRQSGLTTLNNAGVAALPAGTQFSKEECAKVPQGSWLSRVEPGGVKVGLQLCLRTSDGTLGSLHVDNIVAGSQVVSVSFKLWL